MKKINTLKHPINGSPDTFVSIDLETTGLDPNFCEIIEIGAVKVRHGEVVDEFSELVRPSTPIPEAITALTGISNLHVKKAAPIASVIPGFLDFIEGHTLMGQNVRFDVDFLRKAVGAGNIRTAIDNCELARIVLPGLPSYSLDNLIEFFSLDPGNRHRALDDAKVTAQVYLRLLGMVKLLPTHFLGEMKTIADKTGTELELVFEAELMERAGDKLPRKETMFRLPKVPGTGNNIYGDFRTENREYESTVERACLKESDITGVLSEKGKLAQVFENWESRTGQIAMAKKIATAFNDSEILLAEAGTGTGKSLAYLVPSILWAEKAGERVVVSTNTKNLQEQLFFKDIPLLGDALGVPFRAVMLKGRGNYLCLNRWKKLLDHNGKYLTPQERALVLPVASWVNYTSSGDLSETGFFPMLAESGLLERVNSDAISCVGGRCVYKDKCFLNRVRRAAQKAHVIIVNHSLAFSDMTAEGGVLGPYSRIIFDEAHNIEKTALRYLGVSLNYYDIRRVLNRLYARNEGGRGLLSMLGEWLDTSVKGWPEFENHIPTIERAVEAVQEVRKTARTMFDNLYSLIKSEGMRKKDQEGKLRYYPDSNVFAECGFVIEDFNYALDTLLECVQDIELIVSGISPSLLNDREEILADFTKIIQDIQAITDNFEFLRSASGKNVFWFEYSPEGNGFSLRIESAPLDIAEKLAFGLYDHMETVVMTSATLTVARSFSYIRDRLGLDLDNRDRVTEFIASSPFDYQSQTAVFMPAFLPSPKSENYIDSANNVIIEIARNTGRGMLVLFTSRGHLLRAYRELGPEFARCGITLLGQGLDGSRDQILRRFKTETKSVLFGNDSFWEGVDVPGKALEIVVIVRIPFSVPTDPVIEAQMEEVGRLGGRPFMDFSVPGAAIRLRQGAGRLIRSRTDTGAIVVLDNRIITARYGETFRKCLHGKSSRPESVQGLVDGLKVWFSV